MCIRDSHDIYPEITDYESYKQWVEGSVDPDAPSNLTIEDIFAEGDKVVYYWTSPGGAWGINVYRFADGKIVGLWWGKDVLPVFIERGLLPPLPTTAVESRTWGQVKSLFK